MQRTSLSPPYQLAYNSPTSFRLKFVSKSYLENFLKIDFEKQTLFLNKCINSGDEYNLPSYNLNSLN